LIGVSQSGGWVDKRQLWYKTWKNKTVISTLQNHDSIAWNGAERQMLLCMVGATSWKQLTCMQRAAGII